MTIFIFVILSVLIICAIAACLHKNLLVSIVIFMAFSTVLCTLWIALEAPDLAITEAAVGAGVTSILFFVTLKKIHSIEEDYHE